MDFTVEITTLQIIAGILGLTTIGLVLFLSRSSRKKSRSHK